MIQSVANKCVRTATAATIRGRAISVRNSSVGYWIPQQRSIHGEIKSVPNANHVAIQMVNYALSHACSLNSGNVALSYGEFLHATGNFETAKEMYQKAIQGVAETKDSMCSGNMNLKAVSLAATFALGQLESHIGNFGEAEETLTSALTRAEEYYGHNHPNVGVILTGVALMYRNKAKQERSNIVLFRKCERKCFYPFLLNNILHSISVSLAVNDSTYIPEIETPPYPWLIKRRN